MPQASAGDEKHRAIAGRGGWRSTKLHLALISMAVLTAVFLFVVWKTNSSAGWGEYCIALVTLVGMYSSANVAATFAQRPPPTP